MHAIASANPSGARLAEGRRSCCRRIDRQFAGRSRQCIQNKLRRCVSRFTDAQADVPVGFVRCDRRKKLFQAFKGIGVKAAKQGIHANGYYPQCVSQRQEFFEIRLWWNAR